eukprot:TRINITY_DN2116_c0_g1_i1.p1 TRINITY_DN2116_c0_g1~~TRINITY_DN2116_c0_g1_i1.p1  ORF type:complete len:345 (-),score=93.68 TRINITY_DN2116_c0_g1_i1:12-1046(-)
MTSIIPTIIILSDDNDILELLLQQISLQLDFTINIIPLKSLKELKQNFINLNSIDLSNCYFIEFSVDCKPLIPEPFISLLKVIHLHSFESYTPSMKYFKTFSLLIEEDWEIFVEFLKNTLITAIETKNKENLGFKKKVIKKVSNYELENENKHSKQFMLDFFSKTVKIIESFETLIEETSTQRTEKDKEKEIKENIAFMKREIENQKNLVLADEILEFQFNQWHGEWNKICKALQLIQYTQRINFESGLALSQFITGDSNNDSREENNYNISFFGTQSPKTHKRSRSRTTSKLHELHFPSDTASFLSDNSNYQDNIMYGIKPTDSPVRKVHHVISAGFRFTDKK